MKEALLSNRLPERQIFNLTLGTAYKQCFLIYAIFCFYLKIQSVRPRSSLLSSAINIVYMNNPPFYSVISPIALSDFLNAFALTAFQLSHGVHLVHTLLHNLFNHQPMHNNRRKRA